jgi:hypothetical protein
MGISIQVIGGLNGRRDQLLRHYEGVVHEYLSLNKGMLKAYYHKHVRKPTFKTQLTTSKPDAGTQAEPEIDYSGIDNMMDCTYRVSLSWPIDWIRSLFVLAYCCTMQHAVGTVPNQDHC